MNRLGLRRKTTEYLKMCGWDDITEKEMNVVFSEILESGKPISEVVDKWHNAKKNKPKEMAEYVKTTYSGTVDYIMMLRIKTFGIDKVRERQLKNKEEPLFEAYL